MNLGLQLVETSCKLMAWHHLGSSRQEECPSLLNPLFRMKQRFVYWLIDLLSDSEISPKGLS